MKYYFYSLLILGLLFTACSDKNDGFPEVDEGDEIAVYIKLDGMIQTRMDVEPSQSDSAATVYTAILYFLDDQEDPFCWRVRTVGANSTADLTVEELRAGAVFRVPEQATQVYVVANWNSCDSLENYADFPIGRIRLSQIQSTLLDINQIAYWKLADGTVTGNPLNPAAENNVYKIAMMDGTAPIREYNSNTQSGWAGGEGPVEGDWYAAVTVTPLVARLEWGTRWFAINASRYTLNEVYINNYYRMLPLTLNREGFLITHNGDVPARYTPGDPLFAYTDYRAMYIPFYYRVDRPDGADTGIRLEENRKFAFHTFGNTSPPEVILRFTDIYYRNTPDTRVPEGYAVIKFRDQATGEEITAFERNKIYKPYAYINDEYGRENGFRIEYATLPPTPEPTPDIELWVFLEIRDWVNVDIPSIL